jgi:predicted RecB family nuclease
LQLLDNATVLSATDLNNFLACEHLTALDLAVLRDGLTRPKERPGQATLLAELGEAHEGAYLEKLGDDGYEVVTIERSRDLWAGAEATEAAMWAGARVIYQATFFDGVWVGHADFLRRIDERLDGGRWAWHYEVEDTKLARHTEPYFLLQLCYYSEHVARVQGAAARSMHVVLGNGERQSFRVDDFAAYYRDVKSRFLHRLGDSAATYPLPVSHCGLCVWDAACTARRKQDDHLSGVASITRLQTGRLNDAGITTLAALATAPDIARPEKMVGPTFEKLRRQARLQDEQRRARAAGDVDSDRYEFIEDAVENKRGFCLLPPPSPGDVFFDMEGDPYYDIGTGLEYLFGAYTADDATFTPFWGCDRSERPASDRLAEKRGFEAFIDFVMERRERFPDLHVYHYASYEKTALQKLSQRHATREDEVDIILREEVLVDLYRVVRQALVVGQPSYSIKKIEEYYGKRGDASGVKGGDESILQFEAWLASRGAAQRNDALLDDLQQYNEYDCVSTFGLREWLLELRAKAAAQLGVEIPPYAGKPAEEIKTRETKYGDLIRHLEERIPEDFVFDDADPRHDAVRPFYLARHLLEYHWREDKPVWWRFHDRCSTYQEDPDQLRDDSETIVGLELVGVPLPLKNSLGYEFRFPLQLHKIDTDKCFDLQTKDAAGEITEIDDGDEFGRLILKRGPSLKDKPLPPAITVRSIVPASSVLDAIARFAEALLADGDACRYRAAFDVLTVAPPRLRDRAPGSRIQPEQVNEASVRAASDALDASYLFVQGPPGAGKTYIGARLIVDLIRRGNRVGVTANSHKAIHNLLDELERVADELGVSFAGVKKSKKGDPDTEYRGAHFISEDAPLASFDAQLFAGTAWAFGPAAMDQRLDYLFIDEAGQVSLPAAIAVMTSARNVVLLGDPLQLPQVTHTQHPGDVGASVLEHLLGDELRPVAPDRGILLTDSYRMHPDVCSFISELLYEGKLHSAPGRERQSVRSAGLSGTGLRYIPVPHQLNAQRSPEEASRIADEIETLLRGAVTDIDGRLRPVLPSDIIVVAPYNAHVHCIRKELQARPACAGVQVGTVDKFQGREAYVVFFATGASTPEDASRGVSFVFDRQRFNVAISRARALAVLVGSPALLAHRCGSVEDVRIANGVCRFLELAAARDEDVSPEPPGQLSLLLI